MGAPRLGLAPQAEVTERRLPSLLGRRLPSLPPGHTSRISLTSTGNATETRTRSRCRSPKASEFGSENEFERVGRSPCPTQGFERARPGCRRRRLRPSRLGSLRSGVCAPRRPQRRCHGAQTSRLLGRRLPSLPPRHTRSSLSDFQRQRHRNANSFSVPQPESIGVRKRERVRESWAQPLSYPGLRTCAARMQTKTSATQQTWKSALRRLRSGVCAPASALRGVRSAGATERRRHVCWVADFQVCLRATRVEAL